MMMMQIQVLAIVFLSLNDAAAEEKVALRLQHDPARILRYKNSYAYSYFSNRAEMFGGSGSFSVENRGRWTTRERVVEPSPDSLDEPTQVESLVIKAGSQVVLAGQPLSYEEMPETLEVLKDRAFSWTLDERGRLRSFKPLFKAYRLGREDIVTDLQQTWTPGICPTLPEEPVETGDSWTGEYTMEVPYAEITHRGQKALLKVSSTYTLKKLKVKKGRTIAVIGEDREVMYNGWMFAEYVSVFLEGSGKGGAEWELDLDRGVVLKHKAQVGIERMEVTLEGENSPRGDIEAEIRIVFERELEKVE